MLQKHRIYQEKQGSRAVQWYSPAVLVYTACIMQHLVRLPAGPGSDLSALKTTRIFLSVVVLSWSHSLVCCTCTAVRTTEQMFKKLLLVSLKSLMPLCCKVLSP